MRFVSNTNILKVRLRIQGCLQGSVSGAGLWISVSSVWEGGKEGQKRGRKGAKKEGRERRKKKRREEGREGGVGAGREGD